MSTEVTAGRARLDACLERLTRLHPRVIDLSLDRVFRLLEALGAPHTNLPPVIHVAGTNGKGSVIAYMAAALKAAGRRAHIYTSPHLVRFNERVVLGNVEATDEQLVDTLERVEAANRGGDVTFFEITTAAAFLLFAERPADYVLLETGLGGRLDATNVVALPKLCVITPISLDHQAFLGDTIEEIAGEKAGIFKHGVQAIVGPQKKDALTVLEARAETVGTPLKIWARDWHLEDTHVFRGQRWQLRLPAPGLAGAHQLENAGTAVAALELLDDPLVTPEIAAAGVSTATWPARLQELTQAADLPAGWRLWLDGGHNPAAGQALADWAMARGRPLHLVGAMLRIKSAADFLAPLARHTASFHALAMAGGHDGYAPEELAGIAQETGILQAAAAKGWREAIRRIVADAPAPGDILICGSLYLAGEVLGEIDGMSASS